MVIVPMGKQNGTRFQTLFRQKRDDALLFRAGIENDRLPAVFPVHNITIRPNQADRNALYLQHLFPFYPFPLSISYTP